MVYREHGGVQAWPDVYAALVQVIHRLEMLHWLQTEDAAATPPKNRPEPTPPPMTQAEKDAKAAAVERRAERYLRRTRN